MIAKRLAVPASLVVLALSAAACDDAVSKEHKAEQAQAQADQQKTAAEQQAADKTAAAWDAAGQQADRAQAHANRAWDAASVALTDEENDYSSRINKVVTDIDSRLSDLRASAYDAGAAERTLSSEVTANMDKRRDALLADQRALDKVTTDSWAALRLKIDTDLDESKNYVRTASARIKSARR